MNQPWLAHFRKLFTGAPSPTQGTAGSSGSAPLPFDPNTVLWAGRKLPIGQATSVRELMQDQQRRDLLRQAEASRVFEETRLQITNLMTRLQDLQAQQHREAIVHQAEAKVEDKKADARAEEKRQEALKIPLRQRASDPALKALLAPFITPGYHQLKGSSYDKAPLSYTDLHGCGALEASLPGLTKLVQIATYVGDRERPRWELRGGRLGWGHFQESIEKAKEAQQALIELGPVLVELGMFSP